ncbi:MAG: GH3 auxin-responsive promoter family protein [Phycisphaerales bacterium JB039]
MPPAPAPLTIRSAVGAGLRLRVARRARLLSDLAHWRKATASIQRRQLRSLVEKAASTEIGRECGFARLAQLPEAELLGAYRKALPIGDYLAYAERLQRMREQGEADVLWPGLVRDFAQTSGTTAGDKYIPVSGEMMRSNYLASLDIFAHSVRRGISLERLLGGRALFLGGSSSVTANEHGVRTGDLSGLVTRLIRWPLTAVYSPGREVALLSHWPTKIDRMARVTMGQDIRMINGMPSWCVALMERILEIAREQGAGARRMRDIWPNLMMFVHGGVKYAPFEPRIRQLFSGAADGDDIPHRLELYPASEGFIALQDEAHDPGLRLLTDIGNFFEFVPLEEVDAPDAAAFACDEVEKGQRYVVVMSTCAGLFRYLIGDVVEFDTVCDRLDGRAGDGPCRLRIVGRHRHFINAFGENLIVENIEEAVAAASRQSGLIVGEFTAAPVYPGNGRRAGLEILVEMPAPPGPEQIGAFGRAADEMLQRVCHDYEVKRTGDLGMAPPTITVVPMGTFHRWMESRGKLGGQHKAPRCANGRETLEAVAAIASPATA